MTPITEAIEVAAAEEAPAGSSSSADHIRRALELFAVRQTPDFRNAIKEAIQALEAEVRLTSGKANATLGDALKGTRDILHPALQRAAHALHGFSSEDGGIRHAKLEGDTDPTRDEARFCIVTCSALVNLLRAQRAEAGAAQ